MKKVFLLFMSFLALSLGFLGCSDSGSDDNNDGGEVKLKEFSAGWWLYDDSYSKVYVLYASDKSVERAGSEKGEYEGSSLSQAKKLYVFTDEKINKSLNKITDESKYPSWALVQQKKIDFVIKDIAGYFVETGKNTGVYYRQYNSSGMFFELMNRDNSEYDQDIIDNTVVKLEVLAGGQYVYKRGEPDEDGTFYSKDDIYNPGTTYTKLKYDDKNDVYLIKDRYYWVSEKDLTQEGIVCVKCTITNPDAVRPLKIFLMSDDTKPYGQDTVFTLEDYEQFYISLN